jgi:asparaginyl-tRNA synthetase
VDGELVPSPAKGQKWELKAKAFRLLGRADETFPLQKKGHTVEFLRTIPHLRARTNRLGSMMRVRSRMAMAVHEFFQQRGFAYVHTPIVTASDCEGAGELFRVTTLDPGLAGADARRQGRLERRISSPKQAYPHGFRPARGRDPRLRPGSNVYTFGPTFRAENSNTTPPRQRVLDDRAGDGFLRPRGRHDAAPRNFVKTSREDGLGRVRR